MKKFLAVLVVVALTAFSAVAFADVTMSGSVDIRSRAFNDLDHNKDVVDYNRDTQERVRINMDAKVGDAKGRISVETNGGAAPTPDYETWGALETTNGPLSAIREAWLDTPLFGPVGLKAGHQFLALGNAWFLRHMKYGDDAWLAYAGLGNLTVAVANAKLADVAIDRDSDFYAALAVMKLGDTGTAGVDLSKVVFAKPDGVIGSNIMYNIGVNANVVAGPVKLQAELDMQQGSNKAVGALAQGSDYKGNQIVVQGNLNAGPAAVNFTVGRGTGRSVQNAVVGGVVVPGTFVLAQDNKAMVTVQDLDPHITFLYEYKFGQPGLNGAGAHGSFANLTALSAGADVKMGSVTVGGNLWWLQATEKVLLFNGLAGIGGIPLARSESDLGIEIDARVNWKMSDAVSWNWLLGYFMPGSAYDTIDPIMSAIVGANVVKSADPTTGIQGVLSMKFQ